MIYLGIIIGLELLSLLDENMCNFILVISRQLNNVGSICTDANLFN